MRNQEHTTVTPTEQSAAILRGLLALAPGFALLVGCTHGDAIIFARNKQVGVKVGMDTKEIPEVSIGYNGQDFAFIPLYKKGYKPKDQGSEPPKFDKDAKYLAVKTKDWREDAYSVFGSFTGSAAGKGTLQSGPETTATLTLGDFIATGVAAQLMAEDSGPAAIAQAMEESRVKTDAKIKKVEDEAAEKIKQAKTEGEEKLTKAKLEDAQNLRTREQVIWADRLVTEARTEKDLVKRRTFAGGVLGLSTAQAAELLTDAVLESDLKLRDLARDPKHYEALKRYYTGK